MKTVTHTLNVFGISKDKVTLAIEEQSFGSELSFDVYDLDGDISLQITAEGKNEASAEETCANAMLALKQVLGDTVYASDSEGIAYTAVNSLKRNNLKIATAESCTGGMLSEYLTSVSGSSEIVEIGIVAYSDRIKRDALSVPEPTLSTYGAISPQTAMYLAKNVRALGDASIGIGITGNAGPSAAEDKPVGLVYVSIADKNKYFIKKLELPSELGRDKIRTYATLTALDLIRRYTSALPFSMEGMVEYGQEFVFEEKASENAPVEEVIEAPATFDPNVNFVIYETFDQEEEETTSPNKPSFSFDFKALGKKNRNGILSIFPNKNDKLRDTVLKIASLVSSVMLIVSSCVIISHFTVESTQRKIIETARNNFVYENIEVNKEDNTYSAFDELKAQNPDIRGWISISNTEVNNPIYQSSDNDFYLKHNMLGKKSKYGALFFDYRNTIDVEGSSQNLTIYGHNMKDKSMFGTLSKYRDLKFYKENPVINLKTLYNEKRYVIFAVMITNASKAQDNGYLYNYTSPSFKTQDDFLSWINEAKERSLIKTDIEIEKNDEILTLSTCCYDFDDARFVIMAKALDVDEKVPNIATARLNPNVHYPQAWYDKQGLKGFVKSEETSTKEPSLPEEYINDTSSDESSSFDGSSEESSSTESSSSAPSSSVVVTPQPEPEEGPEAEQPESPDEQPQPTE